MKIANPDRTIGEVMTEQGKRPGGWYEMETLVGIVRGLSPDFVRVDTMTSEQSLRLRSELSRLEEHPWRYAVQRLADGMVTVRAVEQRSRVTETQPQRLGGRAWEADPQGFFGTPDGIVHTSSGPVLAGSEHDPRLAPGWDDDDE